MGDDGDCMDEPAASMKAVKVDTKTGGAGEWNEETCSDDAGSLTLIINLEKPIALQADNKVDFVEGPDGHSIFYTWLHTSFVDREKVHLRACDLDRFHKKHRVTSDFCVTLIFDLSNSSSGDKGETNVVRVE